MRFLHVIGFHVGLLDFWAATISAFLASLHFRPEEFWRWMWFVLFVLLFLLFFLAWLVDLGATL